jgi:hypothetical protein
MYCPDAIYPMEDFHQDIWRSDLCQTAKGQKVPQTWGIIQETYAALSGGLYSQGPWPHGCLI